VRQRILAASAGALAVAGGLAAVPALVHSSATGATSASASGTTLTVTRPASGSGSVPSCTFPSFPAL